MSKMQEYLVDQIVKAIESEKDKQGRSIFDVDIDEAYFDMYDELRIDGSYDTAFEHWYCDATFYEPVEDELNREYLGADGVGLLDLLPEDIRKFVEVKEVVEDEKDMSFPYDEEY